ELITGAHDDIDVEAEPARERLPCLRCQLVGGRVAGHDDVAALQVGAYVREALALERPTQLEHRDALVRAEVDPSQKQDLAHLGGLAPFARAIGGLLVGRRGDVELMTLHWDRQDGLTVAARTSAASALAAAARAVHAWPHP